MSKTTDQKEKASDQSSPADQQPQNGVMTINMTFARLALLLVAVNVLFTGYAIVKLSEVAPPDEGAEPALTIPVSEPSPPAS